MKKQIKQYAVALTGVAVIFSLSITATQAQELQHPLGTKLLKDKFHKEIVIENPTRNSTLAADALPSSFDWGPTADNPTGRNITEPVRDQLSCGSCWAFASVALLEAATNYTYGFTTDLSEEVLVSDCCDAGDCNGGYLDDAADWMVSTGTTTEDCWAYSAENGTCSGYCGDPTLGRINSWGYASGNWYTINIAKMKDALVHHGPLVTAFEVYSDFYDYTDGVYQHQTGSYLGGHAVLLTGYVDDETVPGGGYFIVKNSWGTGFGIDGYFYVAYNSNCSFGMEATYYKGFVVYHLNN